MENEQKEVTPGADTVPESAPPSGPFISLANRGEVLIESIINDAEFMALVKMNLSKIIKERLNRKPARDGYRYKRDWYDKMSAENQLNLKFFIENIENVWLRKSSINSSTRKIIEYVCNTALSEYDQIQVI